MAKRLRWVKVTGLPIGEPLFDDTFAQSHKNWCGDWLNEKCSIVADAINNFIAAYDRSYTRVLETQADGETAEAFLFTDLGMSDDAVREWFKELWESAVDAPAVLKRWDVMLQEFLINGGYTLADVRDGFM